jgi:leucine dehydrogenase
VGSVLGPTGTPTARGVLLALVVAVEERLGQVGLTGLSVALQGLGAVGRPLGRALLDAGVARLVVSDAEPSRERDFLAGLTPEERERVSTAAPEDVLFLDVDVASPNAVGGVAGWDEVPRIRAKVLMGAANNQLRATSVAEELALARALHDRGVLYQVDWKHNAAGVIAGWEAWERQDEASNERVLAHVERVCRDGTRENLRRAREAGTTPTEMAYRTVEARVYGSG